MHRNRRHPGAAIGGVLLFTKARLKRIEPQLEVISERIQADRSRIDTLKAMKCEASKEWLKFIRSGNMILKFIEFMRTAIQNYNSFVEIRNILPALERLQSEAEMDMSPILAQLKGIPYAHRSRGARRL